MNTSITKFGLTLLLACAAAWAQDPSKPTEATPAKPEEAKAAAAATAEAASPAPDAEAPITGSLTVGYRWTGDVRGNNNVYRSIVNLGEGVRLLDMDLSVRQSNPLFDRLELRAASWGGDPYNSSYLDVRKDKWYRLTGNYRNIAYFNNLPTFANPFLASGVLTSQRSYDMHRRLLDFDLDLRPGSRFVPFFAVSRASGYGTGVIGFYTTQAEFPVRNLLDDAANNYRGGLRVELARMHLTFEQGYITYEDNQRAYVDNRTPSNRTTPFLGQPLALNNLNQQYGIRGRSPYTQVLFTSNPADWIDLRAAVLISRPKTKINYDQSNAGVFILPNGVGTYTSEKTLITGAEANVPRKTFDVGFEVRPFSRMRVLGGWTGTQYTISSSAILLEQFLSGGTPAGPPGQTTAGNSLYYKYNQEQIDVLFDLTRKLTLRGGQRFVWGESYIPGGPTAQVGRQRGELRQSVGLAGISYRPSTALTASVDAEIASGDKAYFRTSLMDYTRIRARARYQLTSTVQLGVNSWTMRNENPAPAINYNFRYYANSFSTNWRPSKLKFMGLMGEYMYSSLKSDLSYFEPQDLTRVASIYRERGHTGTGMLDLTLPKVAGQAGSLSFGGSFFTVGGSRPTDYFQPVGRLLVPMHKNLHAMAEWRYWGYNENIYRFEGFRTHQMIFGLRWMQQ